MSAPIQNVYFYNPASITTLEAQVAALQTDVGYGQQLSTNCASYLTTGAYTLQNRNPIYGGTGGLVPSNFQNITVAGTPASLAALVPTAYTGQGGHPGYCVAGGNYRTGEEYFAASNRPVNPQGNTWNYTGTLYNFGSSTKSIVGVACAKMMEEGLIKSSDKAYLYYPNMSGTAQYYESVTVSSGPAFPFAAASYTATTGTYDLSTLTIKTLINFNFGILNDFFVLPNAVFPLSQSLGIDAVLSNSNSGTNPVGLAQYLQFATLSRSLLQDAPVGPVSQVYNGDNSYITPAALDQIIDNTRTGVMPLAFKPGTWTNDSLPFNIRSQQSVYDAGWQILGMVLDGYFKSSYNTTNFATLGAYMRSKIFTPLGMNDTYTIYQDTITDLSKYQLADSAFRRSAGFGGANYFWSSSLTGAGYNAFTGTVNGFQGNEAAYAGLVYAGTGYFTVSAEQLRSQYGFVSNSYGCSPSYSTGSVSQLNTAQALYKSQIPVLPGGTGTAELAIGTFTAGPLAWSQQYPDDGISKVIKGVFNYTGAGLSSNYPIASSPVISTVSDFMKFIKMIANRGVGSNGARVLKTESWSYLTSVKVPSLAMQGDNGRIEEEIYGNASLDSFEFPYSSYCLGFYRVNRDISNTTIYGLDENTLFNGGATGNAWYIDLFTGNYAFYATPEILLSSGANSLAGGSIPSGPSLMSDIIVQLIKD